MVKMKESLDILETEDPALELALVAQPLLATSCPEVLDASLLTYANGNYGEINFLHGTFVSLKIDEEKDGSLFEHYVAAGRNGEVEYTLVKHRSFTDRSNPEVMAPRSLTLEDLLPLASHLKKAVVKGSASYRELNVPKQPRQKTRAFSRLGNTLLSGLNRDRHG